MSDPGAWLKRLQDLGWQRSTLAFFDAMPRAEVLEMLPGVAEDWTEEQHDWLLRDAKRQSAGRAFFGQSKEVSSSSFLEDSGRQDVGSRA